MKKEERFMNVWRKTDIPTMNKITVIWPKSMQKDNKKK